MEKLTIKEFADALGVAVITVRTWIAKGKINANKERPKNGFKEVWMIPASELKKAQNADN